MLLYTGLPVAVAAAAMVMDLRQTRVDNGWILLSLAAGLFLRVFMSGGKGAADYAAGVAIPFVMLFWLFCFRMLGPGDIKLLCALGGFMGAEKIWKCVWFSFVLGAVLSLAILISSGEICHRIQYFSAYIQECLYTKKIKPYYRKGMEVENIHFTVPVFLSVLLYAGGVY